MNRFVTKTTHAYLDYPVAVGLIVMPTLLGLGSTNPMAFWLSIVTGVAALLLTLFTDHATGVFPVLPYTLHLMVDATVGLGFIVAPFLLGFTGLDAVYYWAIGATVMIVVALHKAEEDSTAVAA